MTNYADLKSTFAGQAMPFAFVLLDALERNTTAILKRAQGKQIRVASKSIRSREIICRILESDPSMFGVMCFTAPEAVWLSQQGLDELLLGYPTYHPDHIRAICGEIRNGKTITLMVDSAEHIGHIQPTAAAEGVSVGVCLDIDMSTDFPGLHFGVWRSGVTQVEHALTVLAAIEKSPNVHLDGVMGYEAQIAGVTDNAPGAGAKNQVIRFLKKRSIGTIAERRTAIVEALEQRAGKLRFVNGGGTGSMESTREEPLVTEITVGSGFYSPTLFDQYQAFKHEPAAGYAIQIVRKPTADTYTALGGGYIASGAVGADKQPQIFAPEGATLTGLEGTGEVQTPVIYSGSESLNLGDPIFLRHSKAGELCERFNTLLLVKNGEIVDEAPTYRGEGQCFL